jgi:hypothetical protein
MPAKAVILITRDRYLLRDSARRRSFCISTSVISAKFAARLGRRGATAPKSRSPSRYKVSTASWSGRPLASTDCQGSKLMDLRSAGLSNSASARRRLSKKWQVLVHPVIRAGMVVGELLVAMPDPSSSSRSYEPAGAVEQVELFLFAAIVSCGPQPNRPHRYRGAVPVRLHGRWGVTRLSRPAG